MLETVQNAFKRILLCKKEDKSTIIIFNLFHFYCSATNLVCKQHDLCIIKDEPDIQRGETSFPELAKTDLM